MRFNGLTKGFFIFILALVTWAFFDVLSPTSPRFYGPPFLPLSLTR